MKHWTGRASLLVGYLALAGAAFAQGTEARPIDTLPWNATLQEALDEAEDRGAPLAVYVYEACEEGDAPVAIGASDATQVLYGFALYRLDVSEESDEREAFDRHWGSACDLSRMPAVHLFVTDQQAGPASGQWRGMADSFSDPKALAETCQAVLAQIEKPPIDAGFYRNARGAWRRASEALATGDTKGAVQDLEIVVAIASNCGKDFRFTPEAKKQYAELMTTGRTKLDELKKAMSAKDWRIVWSLGRELAGTYQFTVLGSEIGDVLASIDGDPEASKAMESLAAEEENGNTDVRLAEAAKHRTEALRILRLRVPATEVPDDQVTVVFWDAIGDLPGNAKVVLTPEGKRPDVVGIGYWLGADRAVVTGWDLVHDCECMRQPLDAGEGESIGFLDLRSRDDVERKVFALVREHVRWDGRPVVPISIKPGDNGKLNVTWYDGWDADCGHWSYGFSAVDVVAGTVEDRGHAK